MLIPTRTWKYAAILLGVTFLVNLTDIAASPFVERGNEHEYVKSAGYSVKDVEKKEKRENRRSNNYPGIFPDMGCGLYLAESSIPGAGLGVYSGLDVEKGGFLTKYDLPIQVPDMPYHLGEDIKFLLKQYYWNAAGFNGHYEGYSVSTALPSFGMMPNGHMGLVNAQSQINSDDDVARMDFYKDPGAGAVSNYHTTSWTASRFVEKGSEIFLSYGESYFISREPKYGAIPFGDDFIEADRLVAEASVLVKEHSDEGENSKLAQGLWEMIRNVTSPRVQFALPDNITQVDEAAEKGTALHSLPDAIRPLDWLQENGQCMDNLVVKASPISQASRGAFAKRFLPKDSIVAPAPLVQILDKDQLNMYELIEEDGNEPIRSDDTVVTKQLLLNYCFGHKNTSLLFMPYSPVVNFINHNHQANVKIQWSTNKYHHQDWMELTPEEMHVDHSGLMFDIVAIKDIYPGDEVLIDYGQDWQDAWDRHVQEWTPDTFHQNYTHPENMDSKAKIRSATEQEDDPYPYNLETGCYYKYYSEYTEYPRAHDDENNIQYKWRSDDQEIGDGYMRPCVIHASHEVRNRTLYSAVMYNHGAHVEGDFIPHEQYHYVYGIPREAIGFIERRYKGELYMENTFRHPMGIPDHMIPPAWMNLPVKEDALQDEHEDNVTNNDPVDSNIQKNIPLDDMLQN